jgi:isopropylmalate/homocitrate/citramalate synthase
MGMINIQEFIDSKRIKLLYRILHEPLESWNAIGKYWLRKLDIKFNETKVVISFTHFSGIPRISIS